MSFEVFLNVRSVQLCARGGWPGRAASPPATSTVPSRSVTWAAALRGHAISEAGLQLFDTASGRHLALPVSTYFAFYFGQWLDDTTCTIAGERPTRQVDLLVVDARAGTTKVVLPHFTDMGFSKTPPRTASLALPTGRPIIDLY